MKALKCLMAVVFLIFPVFSFGQDESPLTARDSIVKTSWMAGLGYTVLDDSGDVFDELLDVDSQWNAIAFPSRLSLGRYFRNGLGVEAIVAYSQYNKGKVIDGVINEATTDYWSFDSRISFDLNKLIGQTAWFDPYLGAGLGYTRANDQPRATYNAVVGFRAWLSDRWGLDLNSSGKWAMSSEATNHIQHAAGVVYQFGMEKALSKKGEAKQALWEELRKERQRAEDSITGAKKEAEAAKALKEKLAREKEAARLAEAERRRLEAEKQRKEGIVNAIDGFGRVYFDLNSSYLNKTSMAILDKFVPLLRENPGLRLKISAHADSRGEKAYNLWLSERRAKRALDYLLKKGVEPQRLSAEGLGESQLTNHCRDGVKCSEHEHQENRRIDFSILNY